MDAHTCIHTCMHTYTHTYLRPNPPTYIQIVTHIHTYKQACIHTNCDMWMQRIPESLTAYLHSLPLSLSLFLSASTRVSVSLALSHSLCLSLPWCSLICPNTLSHRAKSYKTNPQEKTTMTEVPKGSGVPLKNNDDDKLLQGGYPGYTKSDPRDEF
jgi:hypothetical protein